MQNLWKRFFGFDRTSVRDGAFILRRSFPPSGEVGTSFLGGTPRLPDAVKWPTTQDWEGLSFLGQVDLDALPDTPVRRLLPGGALLFFVDTANEFTGLEQPGASAVLHVSGNLSAIPPREPPASLPPVYGGDAEHLVPWVLPARQPGPSAPRVFPCWNVEVVGLNVTPDSDGPKVNDRSGIQHESASAARLWAAYEFAFGPPPLWEYPTWWKESDLPRLDNHPLPLAQQESVWQPDDTWPYAWINIAIFAAQLIGSLRSAPKTPDPQQVLAEAEAWHAQAERAGLFTAVPAYRRAEFRDWMVAVGPVVPRSFKLTGLNRLTERAFVSGADAMLGYAPEAARALLPGRLVQMLAARHAPFARRRDGTRMVRHQLLSHGRNVQGAPERFAQDHVLLAQFDSDDGMFWQWGDVGVLQFWITLADLAARRFEACVVTMEGH